MQYGKVSICIVKVLIKRKECTMLYVQASLALLDHILYNNNISCRVYTLTHVCNEMGPIYKSLNENKLVGPYSATRFCCVSYYSPRIYGTVGALWLLSYRSHVLQLGWATACKSQRELLEVCSASVSKMSHSLLSLSLLAGFPGL